jgi:hypothetical protein
MRILMLSKALLVGAYQSKLAAIAAHPEVELLAIVRRVGMTRPAGFCWSGFRPRGIGCWWSRFGGTAVFTSTTTPASPNDWPNSGQTSFT